MGQFFQVQAPAVKIAVVPVAGQGGLYRVAVDNPGAQPTTVELTATDPQNSLEFQFEPGELVLAPREQHRPDCWRRPRAPLQPGQPSVRSFSVSVRPVDNQARPASAESSYAPSEPIKQPFPWLVLVVAALALLVLIILVALVLLR